MKGQFGFIILVVIVRSHCQNHDDPTTWILSGQILNHTPGSMPIEPGSRLILQLQDVSDVHTTPLTISQHICNIKAFPIMFNISYFPDEILRGHSYGISAQVVNENNVLCFVNDRLIEVKLLGAGRTTFVDVPVIFLRLDKDNTRMYNVREWPEMLGVDGKTAVELIKQQTGRSTMDDRQTERVFRLGFEKVFIIVKGMQLPKDLRYDRVAIHVDEHGKVAHVPRVG